MDVCLCLKGVCGPTEVEQLWVLKKVFSSQNMLLPNILVKRWRSQQKIISKKKNIELLEIWFWVKVDKKNKKSNKKRYLFKKMLKEWK